MNSCKRSNIQLTQKTGQSIHEVMSQKAVTDAINAETTAREEALAHESESRGADIKAASDALTEAINNEARVRNEQIQQEANTRNTQNQQTVDNLTKQINNEANTRNEQIQQEAKARAAADVELSNSINKVNDQFANYPRLDNGLIPASYLPSYVDDVIEYETLSEFPKPGEEGKIYVTQDTNLTYRWTGSGYIEISKSVGLGETSSTAYPGNKGKELADKLANLNPIKVIQTSNDTIIYPNSSGIFSIVGSNAIAVSQNGSNSITIYEKPDKIPVMVDGKIPVKYLPEGYGSGGSVDPVTLPTINFYNYDGGSNRVDFNEVKNLSIEQSIFKVTLTDNYLRYSLLPSYAKNEASGICGLNSEGKVEETYLPSYIKGIALASSQSGPVTPNNGQISFSRGDGIDISRTGSNNIQFAINEEYLNSKIPNSVQSIYTEEGYLVTPSSSGSITFKSSEFANVHKVDGFEGYVQIDPANGYTKGAENGLCPLVDGKVPDKYLNDNILKYAGEEDVKLEYHKGSTPSYGIYLHTIKDGRFIATSDRNIQIQSTLNSASISFAQDNIIKFDKSSSVRLVYNSTMTVFEPGYCCKNIFVNTSDSAIRITIMDGSEKKFNIICNQFIEIPANTAKKVELYVGENNELILVQ